MADAIAKIIEERAKEAEVEKIKEVVHEKRRHHWRIIRAKKTASDRKKPFWQHD